VERVPQPALVPVKASRVLSFQRRQLREAAQVMPLPDLPPILPSAEVPKGAILVDVMLLRAFFRTDEEYEGAQLLACYHLTLDGLQPIRVERAPGCILIGSRLIGKRAPAPRVYEEEQGAAPAITSEEDA